MQQTKKRTMPLRNLIFIAILGALAAVLMMIKIPLPFAPSFYKLDFSEAIVLIGGFTMGPIAAVAIEAVKILANLLLNGSDSAFVGELCNFIVGCSLVVPATWYYKYHKNYKGAIIGGIIGLLSLLAVSALMNYFVIIPMYVTLYGMPLDTIIAMASKVNGAVGSFGTLILFATVPFNLVKGALSLLIAILLYKRVEKSIIKPNA